MMDTSEKITIYNFYKYWFVDVAIGICVLLIIFLTIFNLPSKRFVRALNKADNYYVQTEYQKALKKYRKAEDIKKDSYKGRLGYMLCLKAMGSEDATDIFTNEALNALDNISLIEGEEAVMAEFYLLTSEILADDKKASLDILARAYEKYEKPSELKTALSDAYFEYGKTVDDLKGRLAAFDEALALSDNAKTIEAVVLETVFEYVNSLVVSDSYADAYKAIDKYEAVLSFDAEAKRAEVARAENLYNIKCDLLIKVNDALAPYYDTYKDSFDKETVEQIDRPMFRVMDYDFAPMLSLDGSEEADTLAYSLSANSYIYADGGFGSDFNGTASGLYTYGDVISYEDGTSAIGYYFFYGEYKAGKRNGYGILLAKTGDNSFVAFEGEWKDDAPNGFGVLYDSKASAFESFTEYSRITYGNFINGLEDGEMTSVMVLSEHPDTYFKDSYTAEMGVVKPLEGDPLELGILDDIPAGKQLIIRLKSIDDGYDYFASVYIDEGSKLSVLGY